MWPVSEPPAHGSPLGLSTESNECSKFSWLVYVSGQEHDTAPWGQPAIRLVAMRQAYPPAAARPPTPPPLPLPPLLVRLHGHQQALEHHEADGLAYAQADGLGQEAAVERSGALFPAQHPGVRHHSTAVSSDVVVVRGASWLPRTGVENDLPTYLPTRVLTSAAHGR